MRRRLITLAAAAALALLSSTPLAAQWRRFSDGIFLNLPVSWKVLQLSEERVTCANDAEEAFFLLTRYPGERYSDITAMDRDLRRKLGDGEQPDSRSGTRPAGQPEERGETYRFHGRDAAYGRLTFMQDGREYQGYLLTLDGAAEDLAAVAFAETGYLEAYREMLLSLLDSLSLGEAGLINPGPVSLFESPLPAPDKELYSLSFDGQSLAVAYSPAAAEASQQLIEREAEVLNVYGGTRYANQAWTRYYRLIYRDLYGRLSPVYAALRQHLSGEELGDRELAALLLRWVQGFDYTRTGTLSDCLSPISAALGSEGDCDSRGLLYVTMLHRFGIDAILMVSSRYSHSVAAVDVPGEGARFPHKGKEYLIAETTENVKLGLIDRRMSAIEGWLGIDFIRPGGP
jgi:hypothetical protein